MLMKDKSVLSINGETGVPSIHWMKNFKTGDDKDLQLEIAKNYTLLYQIKYKETNVKKSYPTGVLYLDDPENPIFSGSVALAGSMLSLVSLISLF